MNQYPDINPGVRPVANRVLVQIALVAEKTAGGIILAADSRDADQATTAEAKVLAIGPIAFKDRQTGTDYAGAPWYAVGDIVRVPKLGGDRFKVKTSDGDVWFAIFWDDEVFGVKE